MVVLVSSLFLAGCAFMRSVGPCYGYGCHGFAPIASGPATAAAPKAKHGKAAAKTSQAIRRPTTPGN